MKVGDVIYTTSVRVAFKNDVAEGSMGYKAPTGEHFVFLLLGSEPKHSGTLDPREVLRQLGWSDTPPPPRSTE